MYVVITQRTKTSKRTTIAAVDAPFEHLPIELPPRYYTDESQSNAISNNTNIHFCIRLVLCRQPAYAACYSSCRANGCCSITMGENNWGRTAIIALETMPRDLQWPLLFINMITSFSKADSPLFAANLYYLHFDMT